MIKGIVRNLDDLGRITFPIEMRRSLGMVAGEPVDMWMDNNTIRVKLFDRDCTKGIVRCIDDLGRVCLPKEYRKALQIKNEDPVDMFLDGQAISVKPVKLQCVFCGTEKEERLIEKNGIHICKDCIDELVEEVVE